MLVIHVHLIVWYNQGQFWNLLIFYISVWLGEVLLIWNIVLKV